MRAALDHPAVMQDEDFVDGGEVLDPVGHEHNAPLARGGEQIGRQPLGQVGG
ncbi:MAG TPA: hypothetical protein VFR23_21235 [Jiangellaceae bacterium]|nr:hypothetical protein [Jiangellaceae bacterium]